MSSTTFIRRCTLFNLNLLKHPTYIRNFPKITSSLKDVYLSTKYCQPRFDPKYFSYNAVRLFCDNKPQHVEEPKKLGLVARFKQMYKEYWYVLVPVHLITSIGWFTTFYYMAKSGVDVVSLLDSMGISERFIAHFRDSSMGYVAVSYGLYKIATPIRYTVTLTGTTLSINYLKKYGYIKPVPSTEKMKEMYEEQKENMKEMYEEQKEKFRERKEELRFRKQLLKEKRDNIIKGYSNYKKELKDIKDK